MLQYSQRAGTRAAVVSGIAADSYLQGDLYRSKLRIHTLQYRTDMLDLESNSQSAFRPDSKYGH